MLPKNLAFMDVETTGTRVNYDRIIEIAILRVENEKLVNTFQTLINPQTHFSPFTQNLTGIGMEDLENAPTFRGVKYDIQSILKDCILVAHNVRFDYSFLRNEFKRENITFSMKHFCTARLSRFLYPKYRKHDLDSLINRFNIKCKNRHRAFDDAKVLYSFFKIINRSFPEEIITKAVNKALKKTSLPINISQKIIDGLPQSPGVYIFYTENGTPLYIGKSINIQDRVMSHFSNDYSSSSEMNIAQQIKSIEFIKTSGELGALFKESDLIKKLQPIYNKTLRNKRRVVILREK